MKQGYMSCKGAKCPYVNSMGEYEFWRDPMYAKYMQEHGHHFSKELAKHASLAMENRDGSDHNWTREDVVKAFEKIGKTIPNGYKACDAHYLANMFYADYFGSSVKTAEECLVLACDYMADPDGYEGRAFYHYLTDCMVKGHVVNWKEML